jgi:hypothetical protein
LPVRRFEDARANEDEGKAATFNLMIEVVPPVFQLGSWTSVADHVVENPQIVIVHQAVRWSEAAGDMDRRPQTQLLQLGGKYVLRDRCSG